MSDKQESVKRKTEISRGLVQTHTVSFNAPPHTHTPLYTVTKIKRRKTVRSNKQIKLMQQKPDCV